MIRRILAASAALALLGVACGDDSDPSSASAEPSETSSESTEAPGSTAETSFPVTVSTPSGDVTIEEPPDSIVSLSPTATEILFAIGADDQVVAVDDQSNFPPEAPIVDGLSGFEPNLEAIADLAPDLVIASNDPGDLVDGLESLGVPTLLQPAATTLDDTYVQIVELGLATGNVSGATDLADSIAVSLSELADRIQTSDPLLTYYHELDDTYFTATSATFLGEIYALAGLENIADAADPDGTGYPQLSAEYIFDADPDYIFLADVKCCGQTASTLAARPGWDALTAVTEGNVVELDDDIASRWGPRVVDLFEAVVNTVTTS